MCVCVLVAQSCSTLATPWTVAHQSPLSMGFFRQEYWSGLPFPSPMRESEREVTQSCLTLCDPMDYSLPRLLSPWDFPGKCTGVGCHCLLRPSRSVVCNSCNPMDCSPPVPSDYGIFQARILNGVVISFSRGSFQPRD